MEVGGLANDFPRAGGTILIGDIREAAFDTIGEVVQTIRVAIVIINVVLKAHLLARNDIVLREDLDTIAKQHDLLDVLNSLSA